MTQVRQIISGTPVSSGITQMALMTDVNDSAKSDGTLIQYDSASQKHIYITASQLPITLAGLSDVDATYKRENYLLYVDDSGNHQYGVLDPDTFATAVDSNGVRFVIKDSASLTLAGLSITGAYSFPTADGANGQALVTDGNGNLAFAFAGDSTGIVVSSMSDLTDVDTNLLPSEGSYLRYDSDNSQYEERDFDSDVRSLFSVSGSLSYDSDTGVISFTQRTDSDIRGLFSGTGDISYDSATGAFSTTGYSGFDSDFGTKSTADLTEDSAALYYTDARARAAISISGGDSDVSYDSATGVLTFSLQHYEASNFDSDFGDKTTDDLTQGSTNLYYSSARADSDARHAISVSGSLSYDDASGVISFTETYDSAGALLTAIKTVDSDTSGINATTIIGIAGSNIATLSGTQTITGAKTFSANTTFTGTVTLDGAPDVIYDVNASNTITLTTDTQTAVDVYSTTSPAAVEYLIHAHDDTAGVTEVHKVLASTGSDILDVTSVAYSSSAIRLFVTRKSGYANDVDVKATKQVVI